jgi:endoglucanase
MLQSATGVAAGLAVPAWAQAPAPPKADASPASAWPAWDAFARQFIGPEGRVTVDEQARTHSEAQSYALFFALVAGDREYFERLLLWTENNLSAGDITSQLPAWLWGKREDGTWGVIDRNAASDADLWIAYALAEAGRLWNEPRYRALSAALARRIVDEEAADLPGLGLTLLPAPHGFALKDGLWRLNPSYTPLQVLHRLAGSTAQPAYRALTVSALRVIVRSAPKGLSPDWTVYNTKIHRRGFRADAADKGRGAYNAIRVYLWAGMLHAQAEERHLLLKTLAPMAHFVREQGYPPESIDILTGQASGPAPAGFSAALLPFLHASGQTDALRAQTLRLQKRAPRHNAYYEQCLMLFGQGWMEGAYRFDAHGRLLPRWKSKP